MNLKPFWFKINDDVSTFANRQLIEQKGFIFKYKLRVTRRHECKENNDKQEALSSS